MRVYSKRSFWLVKVPFILFLLTVVFNWGRAAGEDSARAQMVREYPAIAYQENGRPYCWNVEIFPVRSFELRTMTVKVKREKP